MVTSSIGISIPDKFSVLFEPYRYKTFYGGRGGAKSHSIAKALIVKAYSKKVRILCTREFQTSISDSVMALLVDQINGLGLGPWFHITKTSIVGHNGSEFLFKGLRFNVQEIKSLEGIDICWIEEAQSVSKESLEVLRPTIRKEGSEIWISFNTKSEKDPVYEQFVKNCPDNGVAVKVLWSDNPFLPKTLDEERRLMLETDPEAYRNVWDGEPRTISDDVVFKDKFEVVTFETPEEVRFFHGLDFGFSADPTAGIRCFIVDKCLFIDREAYGYHVELDDLRGFLLENIPTMETWPIRADNSRPETISKLRKPVHVFGTGVQSSEPGLNVKPAAKWNGCVMDRISYLKSFKKIFIHEVNCPNTINEFENYKFKRDSLTGEVLPILIDKSNHAIDALGYSLDEYILAQVTVSDRIQAYGVKSNEEDNVEAMSLNISMASNRFSRIRRHGAWVQ